MWYIVYLHVNLDTDCIRFWLVYNTKSDISENSLRLIKKFLNFCTYQDKYRLHRIIFSSFDYKKTGLDMFVFFCWNRKEIAFGLFQSNDSIIPSHLSIFQPFPISNQKGWKIDSYAHGHRIWFSFLTFPHNINAPSIKVFAAFDRIASSSQVDNLYASL